MSGTLGAWSDRHKNLDESAILYNEAPPSGRSETPQLLPFEDYAPRYVVYRNFKSFEEAWCDNHFGWDLTPSLSRRYTGRLYSRRHGDVVYSDILFDALKGARRPDHIHSRDEYVGINLFLQGRERISHLGRTETVAAGELFLWDVGRPTDFETDGKTRCLSVFVPRSMMAARVPGLDALLGRKVSGGGVGHLLTSHLIALHQSIDMIPMDQRDNVLRATLDMISAWFQPNLYGIRASDQQRRTYRRIVNFIEANLFDERLTADRSATALRLSDRYMRRILSIFGITFSDYVRSRRLERAAAALRSVAFADQTITSVAYRHGFGDAAHFSRLFAAKYGTSPSQFRRPHA
jgi:AraC-like DNA-binding protein